MGVRNETTLYWTDVQLNRQRVQPTWVIAKPAVDGGCSSTQSVITLMSCFMLVCFSTQSVRILMSCLNVSVCFSTRSVIIFMIILMSCFVSVCFTQCPICYDIISCFVSVCFSTRSVIPVILMSCFVSVFFTHCPICYTHVLFCVGIFHSVPDLLYTCLVLCWYVSRSARSVIILMSCFVTVCFSTRSVLRWTWLYPLTRSWRQSRFCAPLLTPRNEWRKREDRGTRQTPGESRLDSWVI